MPQNCSEPSPKVYTGQERRSDMSDCLIPYVETLDYTDDECQPFNAARERVELTRKMHGRLGRGAYLDENARKGILDPGGCVLLELQKGLSWRSQ